TSLTMALSATRDTTNTGSAAGWSARSTKGNRAMIFDAPECSSMSHQGVRLEIAETRARSPFDFATTSTAAAALKCATKGTVKQKWNRAESRIADSPMDTSACTENGACT